MEPHILELISPSSKYFASPKSTMMRADLGDGVLNIKFSNLISLIINYTLYDQAHIRPVSDAPLVQILQGEEDLPHKMRSFLLLQASIPFLVPVLPQ